jgi:hypothetical protein
MSGDPTLTQGSAIAGLDLPNVDPTDLPVFMGSQPGRIAWPARDVAATQVACLAPGTVDQLRTLMLTGDADAAPEPLDIAAPTMWPGVRRLYAVPRRCVSSLSRRGLVTRLLLRDLQWTGLDPRLYSPTETAHIFAADSEGDLAVDVDHAGNVAAPWRATLNGPIVAPELRRADTGQAIRWPTVTIPGGQALDIDLRAGTAWLNDTTDVSGLSVDDDNRPAIEWEIPPGETIHITTNAPSATLWVRDAWL